VGAIGRQVALELAAMGVPWLQLVDPDRVEVVNLGSQGYLEEDLGRLKVEATGELCRRLNSKTEICLEAGRFRRSLKVGDVIFACVDSIATRRLIWEAVGSTCRLYVDGRMSSESLRVLAAADDEGRRYYPRTLFAASEAYAGSCTARSTIFAANVAAGLMLEQFSRWLRRLALDHDLQVNLLSSEMSVASA
jgi:sulfur carrier protein ThiS adenylyltransferase